VEYPFKNPKFIKLKCKKLVLAITKTNNWKHPLGCIYATINIFECF